MSYDPKVTEIKKRLKDVYQTTIKTVNDGHYTSANGVEVKLDDDSFMRDYSRFYYKEFRVDGIPARHHHTVVEVVNNDSIYAGKQLLDEDYNPIVLNFANRHNPGGGVTEGCRAQEEDLFRRTNLFRSMYQFAYYAKVYGLPKSNYQYSMDRDFGGVYTPYATVFRAGRDKDYAFLDKPYKLSFVAVAAMDRRGCSHTELSPSEIEGTKNKMRTILRIGLIHGHDAIVLGAFGCGAFKNPPQQIAELFKEVIEEDEFRDKYRKIVFAIMENHHSGEGHNPNGSLKPFEDVFAKE